VHFNIFRTVKVGQMSHYKVQTHALTSYTLCVSFSYLSVLYDVDIEASACVLSSRYAMLVQSQIDSA